MLGLSLPAAHLRDFTFDFLDLKVRFFPGKFTSGDSRLSRLLVEIKGADLRAAFRCDDRAQQRHHLKLFGAFFDLLDRHECHLFGRVNIKGIAVPMNSAAVYTYGAQDICTTFHDLLITLDQHGLVIADSRNRPKNSNVSFSVFTQLFASGRSKLPRLVETPSFGHSENHAGLQACDWLCSGLVFPIAVYSFCLGHVQSVHVHPGYASLKTEFAPRLRRLQHRYVSPVDLRWRGGIVVNDQLGQGSGALFFW